MNDKQKKLFRIHCCYDNYLQLGEAFDFYKRDLYLEHILSPSLSFYFKALVIFQPLGQQKKSQSGYLHHMEN